MLSKLRGIFDFVQCLQSALGFMLVEPKEADEDKEADEEEEEVEGREEEGEEEDEEGDAEEEETDEEEEGE